MGIGDNIQKIREFGFKKSVSMAGVKLKKCERDIPCPVSKHVKKNLDSIFAKKRYERIIIFENHFGYYNIMMQRPQHLNRNLGDERTLVIYNSYYDVDYQDRSRITRIKESVYVMDLFLYRSYLLRCAEKLPEKYVMVYSTDTMPMRRIRQYEQEQYRIIYEYVDDINPDLISPKKIDGILERHHYLIKNKRTLVVTTASKLYENAKQIDAGANVVLITNGSECEKFVPGIPTTDAGYLEWIRKDSIKVGYYGALANWVDYELLDRITDNPEVQLILIGIEHDDSLQKSGICEKKNVKYFGKKAYDKLAGYVTLWDVCIIPFVVNEITEATSPVKLFEYMAMEKPVITTALPECMKYDAVKIAYDHEEFARLIIQCYQQKDNLDEKEKLKKCAWENDWSEKAAALKRHLKVWEENER